MSYISVGAGLGAILPIRPRVRGTGGGRRPIPVPIMYARGVRPRRGVAGLGDTCPCGELGGVCAYCLDSSNLPAGCTDPTDLLSIACHPELHGSYALPSQTDPCSQTQGWVLSSDGSGVQWCGPGAQPAQLPAWYNPSTGALFQPNSGSALTQCPANNPYYDDLTGLCQASPPSYLGAPAPSPSGGGGSTSGGGSGAVFPTATLQNSSRPGQSFQVGDNYTLTITGAPNSPVAIAAQQNGASLGTTPFGNTDGTGRRVITGQMDKTTLGNWYEVVSVAGVQSQPLQFTVAAAPAGSTSSGLTSGSSSGGSAPTGGTTTGGGGSTQAPAGCFNPLSKWMPDPCISPSIPVGVFTLGAGLAALFLAAQVFGGRR